MNRQKKQGANDKSAAEKPDYSNWVPTRFIHIPGVVTLLFLGLSFAFLALIVVAVFFFLVFVYFAYARYRFSPAGGNAQAQLQELVLAHLDWNGKGNALDIGCGNAPLTSKLAHRYPEEEMKRGAH